MDEALAITEKEVSVFGLLKYCSSLRRALAILGIVGKRHLDWRLDEGHEHQALSEIYKGLHVYQDHCEETEFVLGKQELVLVYEG